VTTGERELGVRPFNARSLVLSVLLGLPSPRLAGGSLVRLAQPFGIAAGAMRTALSRMVARGELVADGGFYELHGRLLERKEAQDIGRRPPGDGWDGSWWIIAVTTPSRTIGERREFRAHMTNARMGELRPDTWLRPANLAAPHVAHGVAIVRGPLAGDDPVDLIDRLWDLPSIAERCRFLLGEIDRSPDDLPTAMRTAAAVVRFLREEPLLPRSLTPADWPVDNLRERYRDFDRELGRAVQRAVADERQGRRIADSAI